MRSSKVSALSTGKTATSLLTRGDTPLPSVQLVADHPQGDVAYTYRQPLSDIPSWKT
jgi:hypothetical protein